jgi:hypothetical protein
VRPISVKISAPPVFVRKVSPPDAVARKTE